MLFASLDFVLFLFIVFVLYWVIRNRAWQNVLLLVASYIFYGYIHPWFCLLIAFSTVLDYFCGLGIERKGGREKIFLILSLCGNLGMLGFFKYFHFFADNFISVVSALGFTVHEPTFRIFLPVGISFYTFQTLSYTIDIYRGKMKARRSFLDFAVFVSFFPQLVAGPIERAQRFLPQVEEKRVWNWSNLDAAAILIVRGFFKKMVIADNLAVFVDRIFIHQSPPLLLLLVGGLAFAIQIYADFGGYTDIARGIAKLLGFDLIKNFDSPYISISPSDFWRRWHISFSTWIRDYVYIPLGGSKVSTRYQFAFVVIATMAISGLWHGAAWNFVIWGVYHGVLVWSYHQIGLGGRWQPGSKLSWLAAWACMTTFTLFGWIIFRTTSMAWLYQTVASGSSGLSGDALIATLAILVMTIFYSFPLLIMFIVDRKFADHKWLHAIIHGGLAALIFLLQRDGGGDFIYFQF